MAPEEIGDPGEFLSSLDEEDRVALLARGGRRRFRPGSNLMYEGQSGEEVFVILSGRIKVTHTTREGREIVLRFCGPGELIGELAVIDGRARSGTVEALEPVEAVAIAAADFRGLLESRSGLALGVLRSVSRRFIDANRKRIEFAAAHTLGRVASRLGELADRYGEPEADGGIAIGLRISQEELAGWTGSSREAVAKALHTLRDLGLIVTERRRIVIKDRDELERQATPI